MRYKSEKSERIARRLEALQHCENETLSQVSSVMLEKLVFYDSCLESWDKSNEKFTAEEIEIGKKCCNAGIDMADAIVNDLRILFLDQHKGTEGRRRG